MYKPIVTYKGATIAFYTTVDEWRDNFQNELKNYRGPVDSGIVPLIPVTAFTTPNSWIIMPNYEKLKIQVVDESYIKIYGAEEYGLDESLFEYLYDVDIPESERLDYQGKKRYVVEHFSNYLSGEIKFCPLSEWVPGKISTKPKVKKEMVVRQFSTVPYAPNLIYTVVKNESRTCSGIKPGDKIRLPNVPGSCTLCYWREDDNYTQMHEIANCRLPEDWQSKILVEFDDKEVRDILIRNAEDEIKHYENEKEKAERNISKNKKRLEELKNNAKI